MPSNTRMHSGHLWRAMIAILVLFGAAHLVAVERQTVRQHHTAGACSTYTSPG